MTGIYRITNKANGKHYIGQSNNILRRFREHKTRALYLENNEYNSSIHRAIRKYGKENFEYKIIEECSQSKLEDREVYWISYYNSYHEGYNETKGGGSGNKGIPQHLKLEQINQVKNLLKNTTKTHREIEQETGVSVAYISNIRNGIYMIDDDEDYPLRPFNTPSKINGKDVNPYKKPCPTCGKEIWSTSKECFECSRISRRVVERPEPLQLAKEIVETSFVAVGKKYGVSGNTIKKWCVGYKIGKLKHEVAMWYEKNK